VAPAASTSSTVPHCEQKLASSGFAWAHFEQNFIRADLAIPDVAA
jgi:hypothetical protein